MRLHQQVIEAQKQVYIRWEYGLIAMLSALLLFSFNILIRNYTLLFHYFSFSLLFSLLQGAFASLPGYGMVFLFLFSMLGGMVVASSMFLLRRQMAMGAAGGVVGIIVSILAPACPGCALSLVGIVGLGGFLALLPFKGIELGILGVLLLLGSLVYLSQKINTVACDVNLRKR